MTTHRVDCGFIRLTDSAVLVAAVEMGFAAEERIDLILHRESNWSSIRDKIALGAYPAAHMLAPMAIALSMGLGPMPVTVDAPFILSVNGNTLAATRDMAATLHAKGAQTGDAASIATALSAVGEDQILRIGVPFPHSMHRVLSHYFLTAAGLAPSRFVFTVAPPPLLPDVLAAGEIDLLVVGEPWGSMSVERGDAEILIPTASIWGAAPEKVLGLRRDWIENEPEATRRLIRALCHAAEWCAKPGSASTLADILALPQYVDAPSDVIERALTGHMITSPEGSMIKVPGALRLGDGVNYPWRSDGMWIAEQAATGWGVQPQSARRIASECFRTDLFRQALETSGPKVPQDSLRIVGRGEDPLNRFFDGATFSFTD